MKASRNCSWQDMASNETPPGPNISSTILKYTPQIAGSTREIMIVAGFHLGMTIINHDLAPLASIHDFLHHYKISQPSFTGRVFTQQMAEFLGLGQESPGKPAEERWILHANSLVCQSAVGLTTYMVSCYSYDHCTTK